MNWRPAAVALLAAATLAGCGSNAAPIEPPSPGLTPGAATEPLDAYGVDLQPCTALQLDGYPTNIAKPSAAYYQGPWCGRLGTAQIYLWAYARDMAAGASDQTVALNVARDAEQLYRDLVAQGFRQVCGHVVEGQSVDVGLERSGETNMIRIAAEGTLGSVDQPLSLVLTSSPAMNDPAVLPDGPNVPCRSGLPYEPVTTASAQQTPVAQ